MTLTPDSYTSKAALAIPTSLPNHSFAFDGVVASMGLREAIDSVRPAMCTDIPILITGPTGSGKSLLARSIHNSSRSGKPFIKINCSSIPVELFESILYGHERGAFSGADTQQKGKLKLAENGTIFLDEIGEMPLIHQPKLLDVLDDGEFWSIGGIQPIKLTARIIVATNRDLREMVRKGTFREDLYDRLACWPVHLPAPTDDPSAIWPAFQFHVEKQAKIYGSVTIAEPDSIRALLLSESGPQTYRQLEKMVQRAVVLARENGGVLNAGVVSVCLATPEGGHSEWPTLAQAELNHITKTLALTGGDVKRAAEMIGTSVQTIYRRLEGSGIELKQFKTESNSKSELCQT